MSLAPFIHGRGANLVWGTQLAQRRIEVLKTNRARFGTGRSETAKRGGVLSHWKQTTRENGETKSVISH
jgi:hypothetical protein